MEISDCVLGLVDVHWTVMSSDTLEITSTDTVLLAIVIVVLQLCPINKPYSIEPTGPILETQLKVTEDP